MCFWASGSTQTYLCELVAIQLCSDGGNYGVRVGALTRVPVYYINEAITLVPYKCGSFLDSVCLTFVPVGVEKN